MLLRTSVLLASLLAFVLASNDDNARGDYNYYCGKFDGVCSDCVAVRGCGYCLASGNCLNGDSSGPLSGTCAHGDYYYESCPTSHSTTTSGCHRYNTCYECTDEQDCGWCAATSSCAQGSAVGPDYGTCSFGWRWETNSCRSTTTTTSEHCSSFSGNCYECVDQGNCGYCGSTGVCARGSVTGPYYQLCRSEWRWETYSCSSTTTTTSDDCPNFNGKCGPCIQQGSCGYCHATHLCQAGDSTGPTNDKYPCTSGWSWTEC